MKNLPLLIITIVGTLALVIGVAVFFSSSASSSKEVDQTILTDGTNNFKGSESAKVTIVEFSDFECPACKAIQPLISQVAAQYPNDVKVVFRHFPLLQIHPHAELAARAAEAADADGYFWQMHDVLFANQEQWAAARSEAEAQELMAGYAQQMGMDKAAFTEKIQSDTVRTTVAQDLALGTQLNVNSTPTIYVNGQKITAPQQLPQVVAEIINQ